MIQRPATPGAGTLPGHSGCNSAIVTWSTPLRNESTRLARVYSGCVKPNRVTAIARMKRGRTGEQPQRAKAEPETDENQRRHLDDEDRPHDPRGQIHKITRPH